MNSNISKLSNQEADIHIKEDSLKHLLTGAHLGATHMNPMLQLSLERRDIRLL